MANSVTFRKFDLAIFRASLDVDFLDLFNLAVCQFCSSVVCACIDSAPSSLKSHIHHVVGVTAKEQVINAYTARIIAAMANACAFWYWTVVQRPGKAMCQPMLAMVGKTAISITRNWAFPDYAFSVYLGLTVKCFRGTFVRHT